MPRVLYKGMGTFSRSYSLSTFVSWNGKNPTIKTNGTGDITIVFPDDWASLNLNYTNTIVHVEGRGYVLKASVNSLSSKDINIVLADDSYVNDGDFLIDIWLA